jgi:hypothetical protein
MSGDLKVEQLEPFRGDGDKGVPCRVLRGDGSVIGEFTLVMSDDGWMPVPLAGAAHPGLLHATAIDFAREVNEGRTKLG